MNGSNHKDQQSCGFNKSENFKFNKYGFEKAA